MRDAAVLVQYLPAEVCFEVEKLAVGAHQVGVAQSLYPAKCEGGDELFLFC